MRASDGAVGAATASFVAEAHAAGTRAPVRLLGQGTHGWRVVRRAGDDLVLDEFGDLWWGRPTRTNETQVIRPCWPEERRANADAIARALEALRRSPTMPL